MSILVNKDTRVVFQGITGESGALHARAYPNEMIVHLFRAVFPLALYLKERARAAEAGATEPSKPAE